MRIQRLLSAAVHLSRQVVPLLVGLVLLVAVILWLSGFFVQRIAAETLPAESPAAPPAEDYELVVSAEQMFYEEALGTLKAASRTVISAKVLATVEEVNVVAGDQVLAGDVLARLSDADLLARVEQQQQALEAARASFQETLTTYQRTQGLRDRDAGLVSQQALEQDRARMLVARADVSRMEQALKEVQVQLSYATIKAARNGRVIDRLTEPGDTVRPGDPLVSLYDADSLRLEAGVAESLAVSLKEGAPLVVTIDALKQTFDATVDEIVPQAESISRSMIVKIKLPTTEGLYEGMFGRARIPVGEREFLCLPTAAVRSIGQLDLIDVVLPDGAVERRLVRLGRRGLPGRVELLSGAEAGERVLVTR